MSMLERLYNDFQENEDIQDSQEVDNESMKFDKKLRELLPVREAIELEEMALDACVAFGKQGFINGVKYAMQLQHECMR